MTGRQLRKHDHYVASTFLTKASLSTTVALQSTARNKSIQQPRIQFLASLVPASELGDCILPYNPYRSYCWQEFQFQTAIIRLFQTPEPTQVSGDKFPRPQACNHAPTNLTSHLPPKPHSIYETSRLFVTNTRLSHPARQYQSLQQPYSLLIFTKITFGGTSSTSIFFGKSDPDGLSASHDYLSRIDKSRLSSESSIPHITTMVLKIASNEHQVAFATSISRWRSRRGFLFFLFFLFWGSWLEKCGTEVEDTWRYGG